MTTFNKLPLTYDGVRLDTLAYAIETLDGRRQLPKTRSRDVSVPGLHGEVPSKYDDYEAGRVLLKMWVRSRDVDGKRVATDDPKKILFKNLDRLYALFGSKWKLGDLRQQVDMDPNDRTSLLANPRLDKSTGTTAFRINRIVNPSFEAAASSTTVRTNMIKNPSFETGVARWTAETGCTIAQGGVLIGGSGSFRCDLTSDGSGSVGIIADSSLSAVTPGKVYTASATVGTLETHPGTHMNILIRWMAPDNITTLSESFSDNPVEVDSYTKIGINQPIPQRISVSAAAPVGAGFAKVVVRVLEPNQPVGAKYVVDAVLLEESATPGEYFDGSFTEIGASWTGAAHDTPSIISQSTTSTWATPATAQLTRVADEPAFGAYCGRLETLDVIIANTPLLWQAGTLPAASAGTQWSGSIYIRSDMDDPPALKLKLAGLDGGGTLVGYGRSGSSTGPDLETLMEIPPERIGVWWRYAVQNAFMPAGATQVRLQILTSSDASGGSIFMFDGATLEAVPHTPFYFDGDTDDAGTEFVWQGTVDNSYTEWRLGAVSSWAAVDGSLVHDTNVDSFPVRAAKACGKYTANTSAANNRIDSNDAVPNTPNQTWTAGAWVWGNVGMERAQIALELRNGGAFVSEIVGPLVTTTGGWTWVAGPEIVQAPPSDRIRMRIQFRQTSGAAPAPSSFARICGAVLTTGPALGLSYFDETTAGAIIGGGGRVRRPPQVRQAFVKADDAIPASTRVLASGDYVSELIVPLKIPTTFWQDVYTLTWTSPTQTATQARIYEITNLQGCTAPLEDLIFIIYGAGTNPRITDPQSGGWVQLNAALPAGQAWRFDAGRWLSGRGSQSLAPTSPAWGDALNITSSAGPRARFAVHPEWSTSLDDHIIRLKLTNATKVQVIGRRKYL